MTSSMLNLPEQPPIYPNTASLPINQNAGALAVVLGTPVTLYGFDGTSWTALTSGSSTTVTSVTGTTNQITASPTTGAVVLTTPQNIDTAAIVQFGTLGLGAAVAASAILSLTSITKGFLPPAMTTTQKNAIVSPAPGLVVYDLILLDLQFYNGTSWVGSSLSGVTSVQGTANQVLVNGTSGSAQTGALTLTTPQNIGTSSSPTFTGLNLSGLTASQAVVTDGSKNLASLAYGTMSSASSLVQRDANQNAFANAFSQNLTSVAGASGTTVLTAASSPTQILTGSADQNFQLPDATTLTVGAKYYFSNNSSQDFCRIKNNSGTQLLNIISGSQAFIELLSNGTANGTWNYRFTVPTNVIWGTNTFSVNLISTSAFKLSTSTVSGWVLTSDASGNGSWVSLTSGAVTSATGTANQILINNTTASQTGSCAFTLANGINLGAYQAATPITGGILAPGAIIIGANTQTDTNSKLEVHGGFLEVAYNSALVRPQNVGLNAGLVAGWNFSGGGAEVNIYNNYNAFSAAANTIFTYTYYNATNSAWQNLISFTNVSTNSARIVLINTNTGMGNGNIYGDTTYDLRLDTGGNNKPIRMDGSFVYVSSLLGVKDSAPATTVSVVGNAQIGFSSGTTAPSTGLVVAGQSAFGTSNPNSTFYLTVSPASSYAYGTVINGSLTARGGQQDAVGIFIVPALIGPGTLTAVSCKGVYISPTFTAGVVATTTFMGIHIDGINMTQTGGGSAPVTSYGLYVSTPAVGTTKYNIYTEGQNVFAYGGTSGSYGASQTPSILLGTDGSLSGVIKLWSDAASNPCLMQNTNGDLHINSATGHPTYLNFYAGSGTLFGNGASGLVGSITAAGNGYVIGQWVVGVTSAGVNDSLLVNHVNNLNPFGIRLLGTPTGTTAGPSTAGIQVGIYTNNTFSPAVVSSGSLSIDCSLQSALSIPSGTQTFGSYVGHSITNTVSQSNASSTSTLNIYYAININSLSTSAVATSTLAVTTAYGIYINSPYVAATRTSCVTQYSLYIPAPSGATNNYAAAILGGLVLAGTTITTNTTLTYSNNIVKVNGSGAVTVTLPATVPGSSTQFWVCRIKDVSNAAASNNITIAGNGHNVDFAASATIATNGGALDIFADGTQYWIS